MGAIVYDVGSALFVAAFVLLLAGLDPKPAWRRHYDPPGDPDSGRAIARFLPWRRMVETWPRAEHGAYSRTGRPRRVGGSKPGERRSAP